MKLTDENLAQANERFTDATTGAANGALYLPLTVGALAYFQSKDGLIDLIDGGPWLMVVGGYGVVSAADLDGPLVPGYAVQFFSVAAQGYKNGYETFETLRDALEDLRASLGHYEFDRALLDGDEWVAAHRAW